MALRIPLSFPSQSDVSTDDGGASSITASIENSPIGRSSVEFQPSSVLLLKGVPGDLRELELLPLLKNYGPIKDILIAHHKRYVFVQFEKIETATKCYEAFTEKIPQIRGNDLYVFYTGKDQISKPKALLHPASRFLRIRFMRMDNQVTENQINALLMAFGLCMKIMIQKIKKWEALVEMQDVFQAVMAKECLVSQPLVAPQMRINFIEEKDMVLKNEDEKEELKDNSSTSSGGGSPISAGRLSMNSFDDLSPTFQMSAFPCFPSYQVMNNNGNNSNTNNGNHNGQMLSSFSAMSQYNQQPLIVPEQCSIMTETNNILLVNNLPESITPLMLFRLFGMYGNVMKVKILFNKPEKGFIEFQSVPQASMAKQNLNGVLIFGKNLICDYAKKSTIVDVTLLKKEPNNKYMGDYTNSSEHRYKYVGSKNHSNIAPPSKVLHLSNLPGDKGPDFFKALFAERGRIEKFMYMKNADSMALVEMATLEEAIYVLIFFHNFDINQKLLKVSFSKYKKIKQEG